MTDGDDVRACTELIFLEAEFLDRRKLRAWLDLFDADCTYWIPMNAQFNDPNEELNLVFDNRARLEDRIARLEGGDAYAQDPPSRTARVVSNVRIERSDAGFVCESAFVLHESRLGRTQMLAGRYRHDLVRDSGGSLRIRRKIVELVNSEDAFSNLTFLL